MIKKTKTFSFMQEAEIQLNSGGADGDISIVFFIGKIQGVQNIICKVPR